MFNGGAICLSHAYIYSEDTLRAARTAKAAKTALAQGNGTRATIGRLRVVISQSPMTVTTAQRGLTVGGLAIRPVVLGTIVVSLQLFA